MLKNLLVIVLLVFVSQINWAQTIETENSGVRFKIKNLGLNSVKGDFSGMKGSVNFDQENVNAASFDVCIDAATIVTGNNKRDEHLKSEDFFSVAEYPTICFKSLSVEKTAEGYLANGSLTMHGVTKSVQIQFTYQDNIFTGVFELFRHDYNIGEGTGSFMVGKKVEITITCVTS